MTGGRGRGRGRRKQHKACMECIDRCMEIHGGSSSPAASRSGGHPPAPLSFFKIMVGNFTETLLVPPKFSQTLHYLIDEEVVIEDTNGRRWKIVASLVNESLTFVDGWQKFVIDHEIEFGNFVVFKVTGNIISAQIFDLSAWEKLHFCEDHQLHGPKRKRGRHLSTSLHSYEPAGSTPQTIQEQALISDDKESPGREKRTITVVRCESPDAELSPGYLISELKEQTLLPNDNSSHVNGCFEGSNTVSTDEKALAVAQADAVSYQNILVAENLEMNAEVLSCNEHSSQGSETSLLLECTEAKTDEEGKHDMAIIACSGNGENLHTFDVGPIYEEVQQPDVPKNCAETMIGKQNMEKITNMNSTDSTVSASNQETLCKSRDFKTTDSGSTDTRILLPPCDDGKAICASQEIIRCNLTSVSNLVYGSLSVPYSSEKKYITQSCEDSQSPKKAGNYTPGGDYADCHAAVRVLSQSMITISDKNFHTLDGRSDHCDDKKDSCCKARQHKDQADNTDSVNLHSTEDESFRFSVHVKSMSWQELPSKLPFILIRKNEARKVLMLQDSCKRMWPVLYLRGKEFSGFAAGWQDFARANHLQQGDRCDFELFISHEKILKVQLHRS